MGASPMLSGGGVVSGVGGPQIPQVIVCLPTDAGIRAAVASAKADSNPSMIFVKPGTIQLAAPVPVISRKTSWYACGQPAISHSSHVADLDWSYANGGVVLQGDGTFPCFQAQDANGNPLDVDKVSVDLNFTSSAIENVEIVGFMIGGASGKGFSRGFSFGAKNQAGLLYSRVANCYVRDCNAAADTYGPNHWAGVFMNCQHSAGQQMFSGLYSYNNSNGWFFSSSVANTVLQCGNFCFQELYHIPGLVLSAADRRKSRGVVFTGQYDGFLNQVYGERIQVNRFNMTQLSESATITSGSSNIQVANSALYQVGMLVFFGTQRGDGSSTTNTIFANQGYVVTSIVNSTNIRVSNSRNGTVITPNASGASTVTTWGMPNIEIYGDRVTGGATLSKVSNLRLFGVDAEGDASGQIYCERMETSTIDISQLGNSTAVVHSHLVLRDSQPNEFRSTNEVIWDADGASVRNFFTGTLKSVIQNTPPLGVFYDSTGTDVHLNLGTAGSGSRLTWKNQSGGGFLKVTRSLGAQYTPWPYAAGVQNTGHGETIAAYSQAATTITIPTIDSGGTNTDNTGYRGRVYNFNTGILGVTAPADIFDGLTGKTLANLPAKTSTSMCFLDYEIQIVNGTKVYLTRGIGAIDWTGATVTQLTNKATATTLNALSGAITMNNASLTNGTAVTFTLNNNQIQAGDVIVVNHKSGGTSGAYLVSVSAVAAGSCAITVYNCTAGALGEAIVLQFKVLKVLQ